MAQKLMPQLTDYQKQWVVQQQGFDPAEYELDDEGFIGPKSVNRVSAQPAVSGPDFPHPNINTEPAPLSAIQTGIKTAIHEAPKAAGAGAAFGAAFGPSTALSAPLGPWAPVGGLVGGGIAALLASLGIGKAQKALEEKFAPDYLAELGAAQQAHPTAATLGGIATMPLGGMNPNPKNIVRAGGALSKIVTGMRPTAPEIQNLANVGIGGVMAPASAIGGALAEGQPIPSGGELTKEALLGLLMNQPNAIGRNFFGFHPAQQGITPEQSRAMLLQRSAQPQVQTEPVGLTPEQIQAVGGVPPQRSVDITPGRPGTKPVKLTPRGLEKAESREYALPGLKLRDEPALMEQAQQQMEAEGGPAKDVQVEPIVQRQHEFIAAQQELRDQQAEHIRQATESVKAEAEALRAANAQRQLPMRLGVQGTPEAIAGRGIARPEVLPEPDYTVASPKEEAGPVYQVRPYEAPKIKADIEAAKPLSEGERIQQEYDLGKRQKSDESGLDKQRPLTEAEQTTAKQLKVGGLPTAPTAMWKQLFDKWALGTRNVEVREDGSLSDKGKPIAGVSYVRDGIKKALALINPAKEGLDTRPHEAFHIFFEDLFNSPKAYDKVLANKGLKTVESSPEFQRINKTRADQGLEPWTAREFLATNHGMEYIRSRLNLNDEKPFTKWWNDFVSHIKTRYTSEATPADFTRLLNYRFENDPAFADYFKTGLKVQPDSLATGTEQQKSESSPLNLTPEQQAIIFSKLTPEETDKIDRLSTEGKTPYPFTLKEFEKGESLQNWAQDVSPDYTIDKMLDHIMPIIGRKLNVKLSRGRDQDVNFVWKLVQNPERLKQLIGDTDAYDVLDALKKSNQAAEILNSPLNAQNSESSGLTPLNHPDVMGTVDSLIHTAKEKKLTTDNARELKSILLQQIDWRNQDKLREWLDNVDPVSQKDWEAFRDRLEDVQDGLPIIAPTKITKIYPDKESFTGPIEQEKGGDKSGQEVQRKEAQVMKKESAKQKSTPISEIQFEEANKESVAKIETTEDIAKRFGIDTKLPAEERAAKFRQEVDAINKRIDTALPAADKATLEAQRSRDIARRVQEESDRYIADRKRRGQFSESSSLADDAALYSELDTQRRAMIKQGDIDSPEFRALWQQLEDVKNRHGGTPPRAEQQSTDSSLYETKLGKWLIPAAAEIDKIAAIGTPEAKTASKGLSEALRLIGRFRGQLEQSFIRDVRAVRPSKSVKEYVTQDNPDFQAVVKRRDMLNDGEEPGFELTPVQQQIDDVLTANLRKSLAMREERPELAHLTDADPNYLPHTMSREASEELANHPSSAKSMKYFDDFSEYQMKHGKKPEDRTEEGVLKNWKILRGAFTKESHNLAESFGPIDESAGIGLPKSMREQNLIDRISRFNRRYARRLAYHDAVETQSEVMKALFNDKNGLESEKSTKFVLEDIRGVREHQEMIRNAVGGIIRAGMMGPLTGAKDFTSNITLGLQHQDVGQVVPGLKYALEHWKENLNSALEHGVVRYNISALEMWEGGNARVDQLLTRGRDIINAVQGRQLLETATRVTAFGQGKYLAIDAFTGKAEGKMTAMQRKFMDDFGPADWRKLDAKPDNAVLDEMAAKFVESVQGTYDYRGQPNITMRGSLAPVLSLARWNVEKFNNFLKYNIEPARQGNWKPLLMSTIGMLIGGEAVNKLVELATNRKERTPKWQEIGEAKDEEKAKLVAYRLAMLSSMSGYAGLLGDVTKSVMDKQFKNRPQTYGNPLLSGLDTTAQNMQFLWEAVDQGDIPGFADVMDNILQDYFQAYRLVAAHASPEKQQELEKRSKFRDLKVFRQGQGLPVGNYSSDRANPYTNPEVKQFKQTGDVKEAVGLLPALVARAKEKSGGDMQEFRRILNSYKLNSYQTMPNPNENPVLFKDYYDYLVETQGLEEATKRVKDYLFQSAMNSAKSGMVP